jgi:hypothetical protein
MTGILDNILDYATTLKTGKVTDKQYKDVNAFLGVGEKEKELDFTEEFNTELSDAEKADFELWLLEESVNGKDWLRDKKDYDIQGFFKAGETLHGGHGTDRFKKPSHPTFSTDSMYHGAEVGGKVYLGGEWGRNGDHDTYRPHPKMFINRTHTPESMREYFKNAESGNELLMK